jgi:hypothetical protein
MKFKIGDRVKTKNPDGIGTIVNISNFDSDDLPYTVLFDKRVNNCIDEWFREIELTLLKSIKSKLK